MKIIKITLWGLGLLLVAAIAWSAYLLLYLNENKEFLEQRFSANLGREVKIEKGISAHWSLTPTITLEGLRIGNPEWTKGEYLVRAERALARIDVLALLKQRLDVKELAIEGADVHLESAEDGQSNWSFGEGGDGVDVSLDILTVRDSKVSHRWPNGEVHHTDIPEIAFKRLGENELGLKARLSYRDVPISASLTTRSQVISRAGERPFQGQIEMPGTTLTVRGQLERSYELASLAVDLKSNRLDLDKSALVQRYALPLTGFLAGIEGQFKTTGSSRDAMLANLDGELKIGNSALTVSAKKDGKPTDLVLKGLGLKVAPNSPVNLKTELVYEKQSYRVELTGGKIAELFDDRKSWKTIHVRASGKAEGEPFEIKGDIGPLSAIPAAKNLVVNLQAEHRGLTFQGEGKIASLETLVGSQLNVAIAGPSLSRLTPWLDVALPDSPPFRFNSHLTGDGSDLRLKGLKLTTGESDISGDLTFPLSTGGRIRGSLESGVLDLHALLDPDDKAKREPGTANQSLLEHELPTDVLAGLDGALKIKVRRLRLVATELELVELDARLDAGHLKLVAKAEGERLTADVDLKPDGADWHLALRHSSSFELGDLIDRGRHGDDRSRSPVTIDADLEGTGKSLMAIFNSTEGTFTMVMGEGLLSEKISRHLPLGDVLYSVLRVVDPSSEQKKQTRLECAVIPLHIAKGVATSPHGVAMRTGEMNLLGGGTWSLDSGEIDLEFKTAQRKGLGLSVVGVADRYIRLTGTIWEPTVGVNPKSALVHGTAAWATGGLSVLFDTAFRRLTASSNPCDAVKKRIGNDAS